MKIKINVDFDPETGELTLPISEYLEQLSDEDKRAFWEDGMVWQIISDTLFDEIANGFACRGMNTRTHELRKKLLSDEALPELLRSFVRGILSDLAVSQESGQRYERAYWKAHSKSGPDCHRHFELGGFNPEYSNWSTAAEIANKLLEKEA